MFNIINPSQGRSQQPEPTGAQPLPPIEPPKLRPPNLSPAVGEAIAPNPWLTSVSSNVLDSRTRLTPDRNKTQNTDFFGHPAFAASCGVLALGYTAWSSYFALVGPSILNGGAQTLPLIAGAIIGWLGTLTCAILAFNLENAFESTTVSDLPEIIDFF